MCNPELPSSAHLNACVGAFAWTDVLLALLCVLLATRSTSDQQACGQRRKRAWPKKKARVRQHAWDVATGAKGPGLEPGPEKLGREGWAGRAGSWAGRAGPEELGRKAWTERLGPEGLGREGWAGRAGTRGKMPGARDQRLEIAGLPHIACCS